MPSVINNRILSAFADVDERGRAAQTDLISEGECLQSYLNGNVPDVDAKPWTIVDIGVRWDTECKTGLIYELGSRLG
jgi:hypothetical protein